MKQATIDVVSSLVLETCCSCGVPFALPDYMVARLKETGKEFYCPSGHAQHYSNSLQKQYEALKAKLEQAEHHAQLEQKWRRAAEEDHEHTRRRLSATKGVLTKTKNRIHNGVCPCCNRSFAHLQRHMQSQHPDYLTEAEET